MTDRSDDTFHWWRRGYCSVCRPRDGDHRQPNPVPGANVLTACVSDLVNPESCTTITVNADPSEPGEPTNLLVTVLDPRAHIDAETGEAVGAAVDISFDAPGEDGAVGSVSGYEIRRVVKADPNALDVTQDEWDAAGATSYIYDESTGYDATTAPGDRVTIRIQGDGAYSRPNGHGLLQLGLTPNKIHTVAIKALDDAVDDTGEQIRNAPIADIDVDLTWSQQTIAFNNANGDVPLTSGGLYEESPSPPRVM